MPINLFVAAFLLAGWYLASEAILKERRYNVHLPGLRPSIPGRSLLILMLALPLLWLAQATAGIYFIGETHRLMIKGKYDDARAALDQAHRFAPATYSPIYDYEAQYSINVLTNTTEKLETEERQRLYREAHSSVDQAIAFNPLFAKLLSRKAIIYFTGFPDLDPEGRIKAESLLRRSLTLNPLLLESRIGLAHLYRLQKRPEEARTILQDAFTYPLPKNRKTLLFYNELARTVLEAEDLAAYNTIILRRNDFAKRHNIPVRQTFPLSPQEIQAILSRKQ